MNLDPQLLAMIVCPACHAGVTADLDAGELLCTGCGLAYPVEGDIPIMLVDQARQPS